jgi:hypothetical protein
VTFAYARSFYEQLGDGAGAGAALRAIGDLESKVGRAAAAMEAYTEARNFYQQIGDALAEADCLFMLGMMNVGSDNMTAAALLAASGRVYRVVGVPNWQRRANSYAARIR